MKYYFLAIAIIAIDQMTKVLVRCNMYLGESIPVWGDFFRLTYIENTGAAFSMLSGQRLILVLVPVIAICGGLIYLHRHRGRHWSLYTSWAMIIGGGIGNLFDRVVFASVTDMFDFSIFPPVFNVADIGVTLGCALMVIYILKYSEQN